MQIGILFIAGLALLAGCAHQQQPPPAAFNWQPPGPDSLGQIPWNWADYSNRVWIAVSGVGLEVTGRNGRSLKEVGFSYSPNTGKSPAEAIAVKSFDMFSGDQAERFLLKVLFGMKDTPLRCSNVVSDGKAFHIYFLKTSAGTTNATYFDASQYHHVF